MNDNVVGINEGEEEKVNGFKKFWKKHGKTIKKGATIIGVGAGMLLAYGLGRANQDDDIYELDELDSELDDVFAPISDESSNSEVE